MKKMYLIIPAYLLMFPAISLAQSPSATISSTPSATASTATQSPVTSSPSATLMPTNITTPSVVPTTEYSAIVVKTDTMRNLIAFSIIALLIIIAFTAGKLSSKESNH